MRTDKQTFLDSPASGFQIVDELDGGDLLRILVHVHDGQLARVGRDRSQREPGVRRHRQRVQGLPAAGPEPRADSRPADHRRRTGVGRGGSKPAAAGAAARRDQLGQRAGRQRSDQRAGRHRHAERVPHGQQRCRRRPAVLPHGRRARITRSATRASRSPASRWAAT